ncbi:DUF1801 domain-containing protein [Inhella sp.]|uniref:DUF1801 domain-containing protein n=1 Tax=Inhella sp. TaxID=1921806 RepID=UPI0035AEDC9C
MQSQAPTIEQYLSELPPERQAPMRELHALLVKKLPKGFEACMNYGMIGYVVPHRLYPAGYHCDPKLPLPFMALASQKNSINLYHMGLYADPAILAWFQTEHAKASSKKLDMGKSCVRYKKPEDMPLKLLGELAGKMSVKDWVARYEAGLKR